MELQLDFYKIKAFWKGHKDLEFSFNFDIILRLEIYTGAYISYCKKIKNLDTLRKLW